MRPAIRRPNGARGATILDVLVLIGCLVLLVNIAVRVPEVIDYQFRHSCYENRDLLNAQFYAALAEEKVEVSRVAGAFVFRSNRESLPSHMVVLLVPEAGGRWTRTLDRVLPGSLLPRNLSCPVDSNGSAGIGVIDYVHLHGGWRCIYEPTHN